MDARNGTRTAEEPLYHADQIVVPEGLPEIMKEWTKECLRAQPADIVAWSASYFATLLAARK